jgi:hypothetical protein
VDETECEVVVVEGRDESESAEWSAEDGDDRTLDLELIYLDVSRFRDWTLETGQDRLTHDVYGMVFPSPCACPDQKS